MFTPDETQFIWHSNVVFFLLSSSLVFTSSCRLTNKLGALVVKRVHILLELAFQLKIQLNTTSFLLSPPMSGHLLFGDFHHGQFNPNVFHSVTFHTRTQCYPPPGSIEANMPHLCTPEQGGITVTGEVTRSCSDWKSDSLGWGKANFTSPYVCTM